MATGFDLETLIKDAREGNYVPGLELRLQSLADAAEEAKLKLDKIEAYARDRAAHASHPILNTVGSGRIASDLFGILGVEYNWGDDDE